MTAKATKVDARKEKIKGRRETKEGEVGKGDTDCDMVRMGDAECKDMIRILEDINEEEEEEEEERESKEDDNILDDNNLDDNIPDDPNVWWARFTLLCEM